MCSAIGDVRFTPNSDHESRHHIRIDPAKMNKREATNGAAGVD
jgi:hypothetical protein